MTDSGEVSENRGLMPSASLSAPRGRGPQLMRHFWSLPSICYPHSLPLLPALCTCKLRASAPSDSCFWNSNPHHETLPTMKMRPCWAGLKTVSVYTCC